MAKTLDDYLKEITTLAGGRDLSTAWFRDKIRQIVPKRIAEGQMRSMIRAGDHSTRPIYGIMNLYYYMPKYEDGILWNDKNLKLKWPTNKPILAKRDTKWRTFEEFKKIYKGF